MFTFPFTTDSSREKGCGSVRMPLRRPEEERKRPAGEAVTSGGWQAHLAGGGRLFLASPVKQGRRAAGGAPLIFGEENKIWSRSIIE